VQHPTAANGVSLLVLVEICFASTDRELVYAVLTSLQVLQQQPDVEQDQQQQQQHGRAAPDLQQLANLWHHFVEASCLNSSHERKALALQLLQLLLPVLTPEAVPVLLSRPLLGCISTALRNKDSYLHASARKSMVSAWPLSCLLLAVCGVLAQLRRVAVCWYTAWL
jgi:hypothetical protein